MPDWPPEPEPFPQSLRRSVEDDGTFGAWLTGPANSIFVQVFRDHCEAVFYSHVQDAFGELGPKEEPEESPLAGKLVGALLDELATTPRGQFHGQSFTRDNLLALDEFLASMIDRVIIRAPATTLRPPSTGSRVIGVVKVLPPAMEDLRAIGDSSVSAEIMYIARTELRIPPEQGHLDGWSVENRQLFWRRAVRLSELPSFLSYEIDSDCDEFRYQACDYLMFYHRASPDERIHYRFSTEALLVTEVVENRRTAVEIPARV